MVNSTKPRIAATCRASRSPWALLLAMLLALLGPARTNVRELESESRESAPTTLELEDDLAEADQAAYARRIERHRHRGEAQRLARAPQEFRSGHAAALRPIHARRQHRRYAIPPPVRAYA